MSRNYYLSICNFGKKGSSTVPSLIATVMDPDRNHIKRQDPDRNWIQIRVKVAKRIRIRIKVMRIRNTA
jgi:hypothetical protein